MSLKGWCECMRKKIFNTKIKLLANKHLPRSSKCKPSWYKSTLEVFLLSIKTIPFLLHVSIFFSLIFLITVYESFVKSDPRNEKIHHSKRFSFIDNAD